jgi:hypothetical protein
MNKRSDVPAVNTNRRCAFSGSITIIAANGVPTLAALVELDPAHPQAPGRAAALQQR